MIDSVTCDKIKGFLQLQGYEVHDEIGRGANGVVFKCAKGGGSPVAVKVVIGSDADLVREVATATELAKLKPEDWDTKFRKPVEAKTRERYYKYINIPTKAWKYPKASIPGFDGLAVFESQLLDGNLQKAIVAAQEADKDFSKLKKIARNSLKALDLLHSKGQVHGDISPDNIYWGAAEPGKTVYQLGDFGKVVTHENLDSGAFKCGVRSDIVSLGKSLLALYLSMVRDTRYYMNFGKTRIPLVENAVSQMGNNAFVSLLGDRCAEFGIKIDDEEKFLDFVKKCVTQCPGCFANAENALRDGYFSKS